MLRTHITESEELNKERRHKQALNEQIKKVNADRIKRILAQQAADDKKRQERLNSITKDYKAGTMKPKNTIKKKQRTAKTKANKRIDKHVDDEEDDIYDIDDPEEGEEGGAYLDDMDLVDYENDRYEDGMAAAGVAQ